eukprot:CAMPEP_0195587128 /NCGR_PEP_ID=MMETSP0814-20130614/30454_1 /TAXON_ID=97485 /ORGANISM="Prymnesium parvum, Strain Texoma1" /LENGTH=52 /DNA_ID=CAMNT_0040725831 /DNA_START=53 /DNA_END=208 /DNA_ORIENTATION=-
MRQPLQAAINLLLQSGVLLNREPSKQLVHLVNVVPFVIVWNAFGPGGVLRVE